jgi:hypothetical protein
MNDYRRTKMATQTIRNSEVKVEMRRMDWVKTAVKTAFFSITAVLIVQAIALTAWPEIALFKPLDSYPRSVLFTLVPAVGATMVFAWMVNHVSNPVKKFVTLSVILLLLSFVPDYALPLENKTLLASSVAAFMHLVAGVVTVTTIVASYSRRGEG